MNTHPSYPDVYCRLCDTKAAHKVGEEIQIPFHNLTTYLCCNHFQYLMGAAPSTYPYTLRTDGD